MKAASAALKLAREADPEHRQEALGCDFAIGTFLNRQIGDPLAERRRAVRIGKDILGLLEDLRLSLHATGAFDTVSADGPSEIAPTNACLKNVLSEIQLRAQSDLAKLNRILLDPAANDRQI
jgi:hypothetical protein